MDEESVGRVVVDSALTVHKELGGPGLLESVYEEALAYELESRGLVIHRQIEVPIIYKGVSLRTALRLDLLVNDKVIVECKAVEQINSVFKFQVLTYLRLKQIKLGYLINFGAKTMREGIQRIVNGL